MSTWYSDWKRAIDSLRQHESSTIHKASMMSWKSFKATQVHDDATEQLQAANISEAVEHREYLRRIVTVTTFLGKRDCFLGSQCGRRS